VLLLLGAATAPQAGSIPTSCDPAVCGWEIEVDGQLVMSGSYDIDPETGDISLQDPVGMTGPDFSVSIDTMGGNVDPELIFGIGATNSSSAPKTFAFSFNLPLAGFNAGAAIATEAALGTTLTASSSADATLFPTLGVGKIVDSQDIQFAPFLSVDKGVDIGDALVDPAGGVSTLRNELENGSIAAGFSFDLMTVTVAFGLVDADQQLGNPGQVGVGLSGRVTQIPLPEPSMMLLVAVGLAGVAGLRRRT